MAFFCCPAGCILVARGGCLRPLPKGRWWRILGGASRRAGEGGGWGRGCGGARAALSCDCGCWVALCAVSGRRGCAGLVRRLRCGGAMAGRGGAGRGLCLATALPGAQLGRWRLDAGARRLLRASLGGCSGNYALAPHTGARWCRDGCCWGELLERSVSCVTRLTGLMDLGRLRV